MDDSMKERLGSLIVNVSIAVYIYIGILVFVFAVTAAQIVIYLKKKKQLKAEGSADDKRTALRRISLIVLIAALLLILSPVLIGVFL